MELSGYEPSDDEWAAHQEITALLARIPELLEASSPFEPLAPRPGSVLASDDAVLGDYPASGLVQTCLASAVDCLDAVEALMVDEDGGVRLYTFAQYPLLRSVIEASAQAIWLLRPDDQAVRIERNLRVRATEHLQDAELYKSFIGKKALPASLEKFKNKQIGYAEIVRNGANDVDGTGSRAELVWRLISGFTHPYARRSTVHSIRVPMGTDAEGRGISASIPSARTVAIALSTAIQMHESMLELVACREATTLMTDSEVDEDFAE
ncbi:hypothetical protein GCM10027052_04170 [Parafrigoribacterium mesophilum]|uniref:hypothetical protein n=1 Tax=Parafrigoribacterium mesophilum TaxID=433646 RepID=UPI0031FD75F8